MTAWPSYLAHHRLVQSQLLRELDPCTEPAVERGQQHVLKDLPPVLHLLPMSERQACSKHPGICRNKWWSVCTCGPDWCSHLQQQQPGYVKDSWYRTQNQHSTEACSSKSFKARKSRDGRQKETGMRRAAELNGEAYNESLLSILLPSENPSCFSH